MKFKAGDKIIILRKSLKEEEDLWKDRWVDRMDCLIGKEVVIKRAKFSYETEYPKYYIDECFAFFPEFVLQKVEKQLCFNFMRDGG